MNKGQQLWAWIRYRGWRYSFAVAWLLISSTTSAFALPWDGPLTAIKNSLTGTVAQTIAVISIAITGAMIAFGEHGKLFTRIMQIVFGISLMVLATPWLSALGI